MPIPIQELARYPVKTSDVLSAVRRSQEVLARLQRLSADTFTPETGNDPNVVCDVFLATVQSAGPTGQADYSDSRYWIKRAVPDPTPSSGAADFSKSMVGTDVLQAIDDPNNNANIRPFWMTATNLSEISAATHSITAGTIVIAIGMPDPDKPLCKWYAFLTGSAAQQSTGTRQGQVYIMGTDNQAVWAYPFSCPEP